MKCYCAEYGLIVAKFQGCIRSWCSGLFAFVVPNMDKRPDSCQFSAMQNRVKFYVKVCGLKTVVAVDAALDGGASHIGFIFFKKSPRNIEPDQAARLRKHVGERAKTVAVTVNASLAELAEIVEIVNPDILQLHGSETPEKVAEIKARYGLPVMKAFAIRTLEDMAVSLKYSNVADILLFDAKPPKGSDLPGGNGVSFDWSLLANFNTEAPIMLSGGLNADNIIEAVSIAHPEGVDISSGVESSPGVKDIELISQFLQIVNNHPVGA